MEGAMNSSKMTPVACSPLLEGAVSSRQGQHLVVQSSATVGAALDEVVAFMRIAEQETFKITMSEESVLVNEVLVHNNDHSTDVHWGARFPSPLANRDCVYRCIAKKLETGEYIIAAKTVRSTPSIANPLSLNSHFAQVENHPVRVPQKNTVRFQSMRLLRFAQLPAGRTRYTSTSWFELGGSNSIIPRRVWSSFATPTAVKAPLSALQYFVQAKATVDFKKADARALGQLLVHVMEPVRTRKHPEELESKLHVFFYRTTVLRELADVHRWVPKMLFQVLRNQSMPTKEGTVYGRAKTKMKGFANSSSSVGAETKELADVTERDAVTIGRATKMLMLSNATPDAAVDEVSRLRSERKRRNCGVRQRRRRQLA
jgi:hypothetical protein